MIGTGRIGGEVAFLAAAKGLIDDIIICDAVRSLEHAQALDLAHASFDVGIVPITVVIRDADVCALGEA